MTLLMLYAHPKNRPKNKQSKTKQNKALKQNLETEKRIAINYILAKYEKRQKNY
jgi:hypothetical protein